MEGFNKKVIIIGIDGGTWKIIDNLIENGYFPYISKLKKNGAYGILKSTLPPISPAAWGTIQTGKDAINNHIYEFYCFNKKTKKTQIVNSSFLDNTIWDILSSVGKKVAVVNIPMTYPPKKVNGFIISGILTPSKESNFTYPLNLKEEILKKLPNYQLKYTDEKRYGNPIYNLKEFINNRINNLKDRTKLCVYLTHNYKLDILMMNFQANDILQHSLWGYIDEDHNLYNPQIKKYIFKKFYKTLDFCTEVIIEEFKRVQNGELMIIIISDHGFETHKKQFNLGDWLYQLGLLKIKKFPIKKILRSRFRYLIQNLPFKNANLILIRRLKKLVSTLSIRNGQSNKSEELIEILDFQNSFAYSTGIGLYGYIFIFEEGKNRIKLMNYIKKKLLKLKDNETGAPIVKRVFFREEIYRGDKPEVIPDIIIQPHNGYSFLGMIKGKKKLLEKIDIKESESIGKHHENGIIIINNKFFKKENIKDANLKDILPTILKYFDLPIPDTIEGKALY